MAFILVGANGWLGSRVVATELAQYMITAHLFLAILVVFALLFALVRSKSDYVLTKAQGSRRKGIRLLLIGVMGLTLAQLLLGTQVRAALDAVIKQIGYTQRENWISQIGLEFYIHRSFSLVILAVNLVLIYQLRKDDRAGWFKWIPGLLLGVYRAGNPDRCYDGLF